MLEYSERDGFFFSTEDRNKSSSYESIILDFSKLKPYVLEPVCESVCESHMFFVRIRA